ncbi:MarR family winged helix-turn-helix transcriptional regulator [Thalassococcus sp. CAU 1522]|uniref:MarR family winged helix-turn-helix transcriptional regulator n=1 Tax=Thalassococcus arenae TaxID=2851652 RepID=A0ABS6N329_9RHOB|nr:MarR family winged helix-turn-helix transcriptional regulator [Thalassococcus arenae]MBV2358435.1 MarR family winged helix-turn-helix transcriptional regulator [Thalassococcus arenae]
MPDTTPDAPGRTFQLFNEVGIIAQLSRAFLEARLPDGMLLPHFSVVNHLIRVKDGRTPLELARSFQVPKTTMTHTLAGLEKHKFVELRRNPDDARSKQVWLTETGRRFRDEAIKAIGPDMAPITDVLSEDEIGFLIDALGRLRRRLDEARG